MANQEGSTPPRSGVKTQLVIDGTTVDVEYLGDGHYSTILGTFNLDELERYVRGRNRAQNQSGGAETYPVGGSGYWARVLDGTDVYRAPDR